MNHWQNVVEMCKQGNRFAQNRLYDNFAKKLYRVALRYVPQPQEAEEVLMNGFLKFFKGLDQFEYRDDNSLEVWLKRIVANEALMVLRKQKSLPFMVDSSEAEEISSLDAPDAAVSAEAIYAAILELPTGYRTIFNLYAIEGFNHEEIANQLNISVGTSKSQLSKARKMLQEKLKNAGYEQAGAI
jgi:RNA polymerase sigma factor (sigma-70 family)